MTRIVKNTTNAGVFVNDTGILLAAFVNYVVPPQDYLIWAASEDVDGLVDDGYLIINDGYIDLAATAGKALIHQIKTLEIQNNGAVIHEDIRRLDFKDLLISTSADGYGKVQYRTSSAENVVHVAKNGSDASGNGSILNPYLTITAALDSITTNSSSNPFLVLVAPGIYTEDTIEMKSWVWVEGSEQDQTIIQSSATNIHVIAGADNSGISKCRIEGATSSGKSAIYYQSLSGTTNTSFFVEDCRFGSNDHLVISDAYYASTAVFIESCKFGSIHQFNHGFLAQNAGRVVVRNSTTTGLSSPFPDYVFKATGTGSQIVLNGVQCRSGTGVTTGPCIHLNDGAKLRALSSNIRGFSKAIWLENAGGAPIVDAVGILCEDNTMDIVVDHPLSDGTFNGSASHHKIYVNPDSFFSVVISCNQLPTDGTGSITVGSILQGDRFDRLANLSKIAREATTFGINDNFDALGITEAYGLTITVNSGEGWLHDPTDFYVKEIVWPSENIDLLPNTINYVFADTNSTIQIAASLPSLESVIPLGRVVTDGYGIRFIEDSDMVMNHYGNRTEHFLRYGIGAVFGSGCLITESDTNPRRLDSTAGVYFYGINRFIVPTGAEITWEAFYRDGYGGFNSISSQNTISNTQYDDGYGLASIPTDKYAKHHLYVVGDTSNAKWFVVYAQGTFDTISEAQDAPLPIVPSFISDAVVRVASIIIHEGEDNIVPGGIFDIRPRIGFSAPSGTAVTDHGQLTGLLDDDHPQYLLISGTRAMTGNLNMGGQNITNVNLVDGVDVSNHASRHLPNGADPIATGTPVDVGSSNSDGIANSLTRSDHVHRGVHSIDANGGTDRYGDVTLQQGTNITVVDNGSGTFTINSTVNTAGTGLVIKAGVVSAGTFSGNPKKATVTFATAFSSSAYAITITGVDSRSWSYESKTASSFIINTSANSALTGEVSWHAIMSGESN